MTKSQNESLTPADRERLREAIQALGEGVVLGRLGVSRLALYRSLAGLPCRRATARWVSSVLDELAQTTATEPVKAPRK